MELACCVLHCHFEPVLLPYVSKNDDGERCFLNNLAFSASQHILYIFWTKRYMLLSVLDQIAKAAETAIMLLWN